MKALGVTAIPAGDWRSEIKYDGYRAIATLNAGTVELWSRNHKPLTADYPEIVAALGRLRVRSATLDGEIVALDAEGRSRFQLLQARSLRAERPNLAYYVFDLLHLDGASWVDRPLEARQERLKKLLPDGTTARVRLSPVFTVEPAVLLAEVRKKGLEGIVAKAAGSRYEPDQRGGAWLKCRLSSEQEFVIGGFTEPRASRSHFGAILVGYHDGVRLLYAGKVGTGFDHGALASLHATFQRLRAPECPFANLPIAHRSRFGAGMNAAEMRRVTWVRPRLVAQIRFAEWTEDGLLRQPVFLGLRRDKAPRQVVREAPAAATR